MFGANHAGGKLANEINDWHPTPISVHENIKQSCVEHGYGGRWNAPNYQVENVICIDMKECYPASMRGQGECSPWFKRFGHPTHHLVRVAVNGELPPDDIIGFAQVRSFRFVSNIHSAIPVWYGKHFACRGGEGCGKTKGWTPIVLLRYLLEAGILESVTIGEAIISLTKQTKVWLPKNRDISCAIIGKFTQGNKVEEKRLTHRVVIDEGELDFLIQDCIKEGTYAGSDKCPLGHILTYYEGHQPQYTHLRASMLAYAHINLLEMLRRFGPNEVVRIATDSIYIRREALYKIENVSAFFKQKTKSSNLAGTGSAEGTQGKGNKFQCPHKIPSCAMCEAGVFYPKEAVKEFAKEVKVHYVNSITGYLPCNKHKPFVCAVCFGEWYFRQGPWKNTQPSKVVTKESEPLKDEKIREIQPGQWHDKGEKIHGPDPNVVYWPKDRHWESLKNITESTAPSIHDPITRSRVSYLNGGGGSGKTTRAI